MKIKSLFGVGFTVASLYLNGQLIKKSTTKSEFTSQQKVLKAYSGGD